MTKSVVQRYFELQRFDETKRTWDRYCLWSDDGKDCISSGRFDLKDRERAGLVLAHIRDVKPKHKFRVVTVTVTVKTVYRVARV